MQLSSHALQCWPYASWTPQDTRLCRRGAHVDDALTDVAADGERNGAAEAGEEEDENRESFFALEIAHLEVLVSRGEKRGMGFTLTENLQGSCCWVAVV